MVPEKKNIAIIELQAIFERKLLSYQFQFCTEIKKLVIRIITLAIVIIYYPLSSTIFVYKYVIHTGKNR